MKACRGSDSEPQLELEPLNESINTRTLEIPLTLNFIENRTTVKTTMTVFSLETRETIGRPLAPCRRQAGGEERMCKS